MSVALLVPGIGVLLAEEQPPAGTTYYIHPDGNDENSGTGNTPESAWRSIARANKAALKPGDRLLLAGGKTFSGNLVIAGPDKGSRDGKPPIVIGSFGDGRATIQAGLGTAVLARDRAGVEVQDLVCKGGDKTKNEGCGIAFVNTLRNNVRLNHLRIRNVEASGFGRKLELPKSETGLNEGFQSAQGAGIFVGGIAADRGKSGFEDVEIAGCVCHGNAYYGILITGFWDDHPARYANNHVHISDCKVFENSGDPLYHENHSGNGILVEDCDGGLVERCMAYENGALCNKAPGGPCGIWAASSNNVTIQCCESYNNRTGTAPDGDGFDLDGGSTNCILQYNYSHDNDGAGYLVYTYAGAPHPDQGNIVRYNISENDAVKGKAYGAIYVGNDGHGMSGVEIYNNTFIARKPVDAAVNIHGKNIAVAFRNNLILSASNIPLVKIDEDNDKLVFQGNLYWNDAAGFRISGKQTYASLDAWRQAGKELLKGKPLGLFADPKLDFSAKRGLFVLSSGSPAVDAGLDLKVNFGIEPGVRDFAGRKIQNGKGLFDLGALGRSE